LIGRISNAFWPVRNMRVTAMKRTTSILILPLLAMTVQIVSPQTRPRSVGPTAPSPAPSAPASVETPKPESKSTVSLRSTEKPPANGGGQAQLDVVRIDTTLVTIPVSVLDRNGRFIPDLQVEDFHIYEEGIEQEIAYFASTERPFTVILMLDTSASTWSRLG